MHRVFLSLGSNQGKRKLNLSKAIKLLDPDLGNIVRVSSVYETDPWGFTHKTKFYNQVVEMETNLEPEMLLDKILEIERQCGRKRHLIKYIARTLDIDILFYDDRMITTANLKIPHPLAHLRHFVLIPLAEIAPELVHPAFDKTISQLAAACKDDKRVLKVL